MSVGIHSKITNQPRPISLVKLLTYIYCYYTTVDAVCQVTLSLVQTCETIGYPECQENLAHGVVYLSLAKKDRSAYNAYMEALSDVRRLGNLPVPLKIRNPVTKLMKDI